MQNYIKINNALIRQPDEGLGYSFETTYSQDTTRSQSGKLHATAMFTVESFSYKASNVAVAEMSQLLKLIMGGGIFTLHYFSPYYGMWRDDKFYVGKGSLSIGRLNESCETYDEVSFNMIGVNPI